MSEKLLKKTKAIFRYMSINGLVDAVILTLAALSANFLTYIYYFDINVLSLIDASSVAKHVLVLSLHYVGALAVTSIAMVLLQQIIAQEEFLGIASKTSGLDLTGFPRSIRLLFWQMFEERTFRAIATVFIFSIFYIGVRNSFILLVISLLVFILVSYLYLRFIGEEYQEKKFRKISVFNHSIVFAIPTITINTEMKHTSMRFMMAKLGIIVMFLALAIGVGRANYVENNVRVKLGNDFKYSMVTSSSSGIVFYDTINKYVFFKSWDALGHIELPLESQKSLKTLVEVDRDKA
ncbi:hypothetical protein [Vibrio anguillarum]|uniref:hypothetical protein n=1 Tax=Vibrio anguillarum TaxID=55601 RepID=UPI000315134F|nr:hypothetical protein [Vibrio anguillarum]